MPRPHRMPQITLPKESNPRTRCCEATMPTVRCHRLHLKSSYKRSFEGNHNADVTLGEFAFVQHTVSRCLLGVTRIYRIRIELIRGTRKMLGDKIRENRLRSFGRRKRTNAMLLKLELAGRRRKGSTKRRVRDMMKVIDVTGTDVHDRA